MHELKGFLTVVALVAAGCITADLPGASAPTDRFDAIEAAIGAPLEPDHDHADPALHGGAFGLERVALVTGRAGDAPQGEAYAETAVKGGFAYLSRYGPESGVAIFDVSDIEQPRFTGSIRLNAGFEPDVEVSDDGNWLFWETQRFPLSAETPTPDPGANAPRGVHIVDVSDKTAPEWAGFVPVTPDGPHSITYANIDGRDILLMSVYAMAYAYTDQPAPGAQRLVITELDTTGAAATLNTLAEFRIAEADTGPGLFPHDVSVSQHPVTGQWLAFVSYWDAGVVIVDVTDPAAPVEIGRLTDFGPAPYAAIHMARIFPTLLHDRVVLVAEPEVSGAPDSGYVTFADVTDPTAPVYLSSWRLPGDLTSAGFRWSPHYFDVNAAGRVVMANYHGGVWVIDVSTPENLMHPRSVAFAEIAPPGAVGFGGLGSGSAFDAWWVGDAHVVAGDTGGGLAVYRFDAP